MRKNYSLALTIIQSLTSKGFTLIELLVVTGVIIVIGSVAVVILVSALRGATKTNTINAVRQNGEYALSQLTKMIRGNQFNGVSADNITYTTLCYFPTPTPAPIQYPYLKITGFDQGVTVIQCGSGANANIASISANPAMFLDLTAVKMTSCSFTCSQNSPLESPVITINFALKQSDTSGLLEKTASSILFSTSVIIRNR